MEYNDKKQHVRKDESRLDVFANREREKKKEEIDRQDRVPITPFLKMIIKK